MFTVPIRDAYVITQISLIKKITAKLQNPLKLKNQYVLLKRETKGRKGSGVTLIENLPIEPDKLKKLAKEIKTKFSSCGNVRDGVIEIQGDHRNKIKLLLEAKEFKVKLSGG